MDTANGMSQGQDNISSTGTSQGTPQQAASTPVQSSEERTFRQSEVNDIVKRVKLEAREDYSRLKSEQPAYFQQKYGDAPSQQQQPYNANATHENEIRRLASEEAQRLRNEWVQEARNKSDADNAQRIVQNFWSKVNPGKEKYQDFDKVTGDIELARFPNVVQLLSEHIENSEDVLYELGKNRMNLSGLEQLAERSPRDAIVQAQRLAKSLKDNESASKVRLPNEPLSQLRPSNTGTGNSEALTMADLKRKYRG